MFAQFMLWCVNRNFVGRFNFAFGDIAAITFLFCAHFLQSWYRWTNSLFIVVLFIVFKIFVLNSRNL